VFYFEREFESWIGLSQNPFFKKKTFVVKTEINCELKDIFSSF